ncbi:MAG: DUF4162 domain-containing protein, partial [Candidatus Hodarchaeota archaeon]
ITILFSSHILNDVQDIANQIGILNKGQIMKIGSPEEFQSSFHIGNIIEIIVAKNTPLCEDLAELPEVEFIQKINEYKQIIHLKSDSNLDLSISKILTRVMKHNCKIRHFNLVKPSLEDVYLKYVGGETN